MSATLAQTKWWRREDDGSLSISPPWVSLVLTAPVPPAKLDDRTKLEIGQGRKPQPKRITMALDDRMMDGPQVDEALGVDEPTVDEWEAGQTEPTTEQVQRLATLTSFPVGFFYREDPAPEPTFGWMCGLGGCRPFGSAVRWGDTADADEVKADLNVALDAMAALLGVGTTEEKQRAMDHAVKLLERYRPDGGS